jgi:CheY-like chemotaxis protein
MPASTGLPPTPPLVLIVDDNLEAREMYTLYLQHAGFRSAEAADGRAAIAQVKRNRPDIILMDAAMPGLNGWDAVSLLKADPETKSIPLIMFTAHVFPEHRARAEAAGANAFIAKPVIPDELAREIRRMLKES